MDNGQNQASPGVAGNVINSVPQQPSSLGQFKVWYLTGKSVFTAKTGTVTLYNGSLVLTDNLTNAQVAQYNLAPDIKIKGGKFSGQVFIKYLNGKQNSFLERQYVFYFYNPKNLLLLLSLWIGPIMAGSKAKIFSDALKQSAGALN